MSKFDLRSVIRQEIVGALKRRNDHSSKDEIERIQQTKSLSRAFGFSGPGFKKNKPGPTAQGPGHSKGFLGPGFKK
jgi:hypothetical protein